MRVRIREDYRANHWWVEYTKWYLVNWVTVDVFIGSDAMNKALACAKRVKKPNIIEVE
jgi:hypothetical protein